MKLRAYGVLAVLCLLAASSASALSVTATNDADLMVSTILGPGITVVPGSVTFTGGATAAGQFTGGNASGLGINQGLILTTGDSNLAPGPNSADNTGIDNGLPGSAILDALVPGYTSRDATILEFDFVSAGGDLFFNYLFASDEYDEYVGSSFNDVFGFFLDGVNIALIPGTSTPVAINNVNMGNFPGLFNGNDPSNGIPPFDIEYDGFTDAFTASALNLAPGVHHITLAIGDSGDGIFDSAVFIQGGTFSDDPTPPDGIIPEPATLALFGLGLSGFVARRLRSKR